MGLGLKSKPFFKIIFMKNKLIILLLLCSFCTSFSQEEKKSKFNIKIGTEYRLTPIYPAAKGLLFNQKNINYNFDKQLNGTSINYALSYSIFKNFDIGFSQSFRYDHIYFKSNTNELFPHTNIGSKESESKNGLITDYHFFVTKYFNIGKSESLFFRLGYSLMNRGTNYTISEFAFYDEALKADHYIVLSYDFSFTALKLDLGYVHDRFEFGLGAYMFGSTSANFHFEEEHKVIIPFFKFSYRLK